MFGFELMTQQAFTVSKGDVFSTAVWWGKNKIGRGVDFYHVSGYIYSNKRVAATGRFHYVDKDSQPYFSSIETKSCAFVPFQNQLPPSFKVEVKLPNDTYYDWLERHAFLIFRKKGEDDNILLYFLPHSIEKVGNATYLIDIFNIIKKHLN
ncbi:hypothetical protein [Alteribacillus sp. HJP-4]|uniref:hypothetical protein n=1 Tax=Alteribacillus sp. HJP-4 TaxID=2775394 RepID=UPI0035CCEAD9